MNALGLRLGRLALGAAASYALAAAYVHWRGGPHGDALALAAGIFSLGLWLLVAFAAIWWLILFAGCVVVGVLAGVFAYGGWETLASAPTDATGDILLYGLFALFGSAVALAAAYGALASAWLTAAATWRLLGAGGGRA
ncbi:MAG: hypothetical protein K8I02_01305 [Candidatus Methylomirabilis sp.]|nr:hypothetical protein [Deltaproteobacteria bacterium]